MSKMQAIRLDYERTFRFPKHIVDYVLKAEWLKPFITGFPDREALWQQIQMKKDQVDRQVLHSVLFSQYEKLEKKDATNQAVEDLLDEKTFTICTAHQPNIFLGPLYLVLKTIHAIKLAETCKDLFPDYHFVPVFYVGSEDHDLDEIGTVYVGEESLHWTTTQQGACGEMVLQELEEELKIVQSLLSDYVEDETWLKQMINACYHPQANLAEATRALLHALFGEKGLLVFDANDRACKELFKPVMKDELLHQRAFPIVYETIERVYGKDHAQAAPREINLFYKKRNQFRERIIAKNAHYEIVSQSLQFDQQELLEELNKNPENFSPNVILRPLLQETLLPNIAFIGGGGEISYWLQLKTLFDHYHIPFPLLILRQSVMIVDRKTEGRITKQHIATEDLFLPPQTLMKRKVESSAAKKQWHDTEKQFKANLEAWLTLSESVSPNLQESTKAHLARINKLVSGLERKFDRHLIRKEEDLQSDLQKIQETLFPKGALMERRCSFLDIYKKFGRSVLDDLLELTDPWGQTFLILKQKET